MAARNASTRSVGRDGGGVEQEHRYSQVEPRSVAGASRVAEPSRIGNAVRRAAGGTGDVHDGPYRAAPRCQPAHGGRHPPRRGRTRPSRPTPPDTIVLIHGFWVTPAQLGGLEGALRGQGLPRADPGLPGLRGRGRGAQRRPDADRGADPPEDHRAPRGRDRASWTSRRSSSGHSAGGASLQLLLDRGLRRGRRGAQLGAHRGRPGAAAVPAEVDVRGASRTRPTGTAPSRSPTSSGTTRSPTPSARRSRAALYERYAIPASGGILWDNVLANFMPGPQDAAVDYHNDDRAAAAVHLRQRGPHHAAEHAAVERQALQVGHASPR